MDRGCFWALRIARATVRHPISAVPGGTRPPRPATDQAAPCRVVRGAAGRDRASAAYRTSAAAASTREHQPEIGGLNCTVLTPTTPLTSTLAEPVKKEITANPAAPSANAVEMTASRSAFDLRVSRRSSQTISASSTPATMLQPARPRAAGRDRDRGCRHGYRPPVEEEIDEEHERAQQDERSGDRE